MSAEERAARAEERARAAYGIVRELDLFGRWGKYGEVVVVGSVGIGVVVQPDIDLEIHSDEPRVADGFAVMGALAELPKARRITYLDARDRHEQGQYWKLEYELTADETWTIDMWVFQRASAVGGGAALTAALREVLTPETRDRILAIKEEAEDLGETGARLLALSGGAGCRRQQLLGVPGVARGSEHLRADLVDAPRRLTRGAAPSSIVAPRPSLSRELLATSNPTTPH